MKKLWLIGLLLLMAGMLMGQTYFTESFEGTWSGTLSAPTGWVQTHPTGTDTEMWEKSVWTTVWTPAGNGTKPTGTSFGTAVAHFNDYNSSSGNVFRLASPDIDLSHSVNPRISFYYFYNTGSAVLRVWASNDGGTSWTNVSGSIGATGSAWTKLNYTLTGYNAANVKIALEVSSAYGNHDLWIDNVNVEETPVPLTGTKTIGASGDYTTFTAAINALNNAGVGSGGVTFNVEAGFTSTELCPAIIVTGTAANPIVFQKSGTGNNPIITAGVGTGTTDAIITINGGDYITFNGIDIAENSANTTTTQQAEYGYYVKNSSATNGAQYITIKNCSITLNKTNTSTKAIYQYTATSATNPTGCNSYNVYQNIQISNSTSGLYFSGTSATYPDLNTEISNCYIGSSSADDMGGAATAYGIYLSSQSGLNVFNNEVKNLTSSYTYGYPYGIYITNGLGEVKVYNNKVHDIKHSSTTATYASYGIYANLATTGTNVIKIYNNMVWAINHSYTGSGSTSYLVYGMYLGGATATNTYHVDFNSVRVSGPATAYSAGVYFASNVAINNLRNNAIANFTAAQTTYKHMAVYFANATAIGASGSIANNNVYYIDNATNGFVVRGSATDYATIPAWATASTFDADSRPTNPRFTSDSNLFIQTGIATPVESKGSYFGGAITWVTDDISGDVRNGDRPDIGADEGNFDEEIECEAPHSQPSNLVLMPYSTNITGSFTATDAEAYLVVRHTERNHDTTPVDGVYYSAAGTLGNGTVIAVGSGISFNSTDLTAETEYNFTIYSYNTSGLNAPKYYVSSPLTGAMTTLPAAPANPAQFTATAAAHNQINLASTANANSNNIMVAWNSTSSFGTPLSTGYTVGGSIAGGGTVLYMGPAAELTNHTGLTEATAYYYKVWSYVSAERTTYYSFSTGLTATATTPATPLTIPVTEDFESITVAGNFPLGWSRAGTKWNTQISPQQYGRMARSGTDYVACTYGATATDWMFSRGITLDATKLYDFSMFYLTDGDTGWTTFKMFIGTAPQGASMTTELASVSSPQNLEYAELEKNAFSPSETGIYYIGFQVVATSNPWYMSFDDFSVTETPSFPAFAVTPTTKDFGTVSVGTTNNQVVTISNAGQGTLNINSVAFTGTGIAQYTVTDANVYPVALAGGQSINVTVGFTPLLPGTYTASLDITDDLAKSVHHVTFTGTAIDYNYGGGDETTTYGGYYFANSLATNAPSRPAYNWIDPIDGRHDEYAGTWSSSADDGYSTAFDLGFNFNFYGVEYTQICVTTNGIVTLGASSSTAYTNAAIPTAATPGAFIALFWDDMEFFSGNTIVYTKALADQFIVTYTNLGRTGDWNAAQQITAQVILYADGNIKMQYAEIIGNISSVHSATVGIENADGTKGVQYHLNGLTGPLQNGLAIMFGQNPATLPVELSSFTATFNVSNIVNVAWTTQSESDMVGYNVYRSLTNNKADAIKLTPQVIQAQNLPTAVHYSYQDSEIEAETTYYYWLEGRGMDQTTNFYGPVTVTTNSGDVPPVIPLVTKLKSAYPNPFNPSTTIAFDVAEASNVCIEIYNVKGQKITTLVNNAYQPGRYNIVWNGKDNQTRSCGSGVYFYRMQAGKYSSIKKVMLVK